MKIIKLISCLFITLLISSCSETRQEKDFKRIKEELLEKYSDGIELMDGWYTMYHLDGTFNTDVEHLSRTTQFQGYLDFEKSNEFGIIHATVEQGVTTQTNYKDFEIHTTTKIYYDGNSYIKEIKKESKNGNTSTSYQGGSLGKIELSFNPGSISEYDINYDDVTFMSQIYNENNYDVDTLGFNKYLVFNQYYNYNKMTGKLFKLILNERYCLEPPTIILPEVEKYEEVNIDSFDLAESYSNITPTVITIPTNKTAVSAGAPLLEGQYKWFSFTPNSTGKYYFIFKGEEDIIVDVSDQPSSNYSNNGIDKSFNGDYMISNDYGAYFSMELQSNQTKYFRVRKGDYEACTTVITAEVSNKPLNDVSPCSYHIHNYTSFTCSNATHHYSKCDCGASSLELHAVSSGSNICTLCGGYVNS